MDLPPHITASPFPCLEETWNLIFCMKCGISFWQKWYGADHQGCVDAVRSSYTHLCTVLKHSISNGCLFMLHSIPFTVLRGGWKSDILHELRELFSPVNELVWSMRAISPSNLAYHSKEGYDILNQQLVSLLAAHHHISPAERIPEIWYFAWKSRVVIGRKDSVWTISGLMVL